MTAYANLTTSELVAAALGVQNQMVSAFQATDWTEATIAYSASVGVTTEALQRVAGYEAGTYPPAAVTIDSIESNLFSVLPWSILFPVEDQYADQYVPFVPADFYAGHWTVPQSGGVAYTLWDGGVEPGTELPAPTSSFVHVPGTGGSYDYFDNWEMHDCQIRNTNRWGIRQYGIRDGVTFRKVLFKDILEEHGIYGSLVGINGATPANPHALLVEDCVFVNCGGQDVQTTTRDDYSISKVAPGSAYVHETPNPTVDFTPGLPVILRRVLGIRSGTKHMPREAFTYSFFSARNSVILEDVALLKHEQDFSTGCLLLEGYEGTGDTYERHASLKRVVLRSAASDQQIMQIHGMYKVDFEEVVFDMPVCQGNQIIVIGNPILNFTNVFAKNAPIVVKQKQTFNGTAVTIGTITNTGYVPV